MKLKNKVAIVTGSSRGIGLATVMTLLDNGVRVAGWSRSNTDVEHPNFKYIQVDISRIKSVENGYSATKFAVRGLSQALYKEVRNDGVKVTCIYPGSVQTNFFDKIDSVIVNENIIKPHDIASTILHCLLSSPNYHHVDIEVRPLHVKK